MPYADDAARRFWERWDAMTPERRAELEQKLQANCARWDVKDFERDGTGKHPNAGRGFREIEKGKNNGSDNC